MSVFSLHVYFIGCKYLRTFKSVATIRNEYRNDLLNKSLRYLLQHVFLGSCDHIFEANISIVASAATSQSQKKLSSNVERFLSYSFYFRKLPVNFRRPPRVDLPDTNGVKWFYCNRDIFNIYCFRIWDIHDRLLHNLLIAYFWTWKLKKFSYFPYQKYIMGREI